MIKFLPLFLITIFSSRLVAETTPSAVVAGSIANAWTQAGVRATDKPLDLAIQGNGFFVLRLPSGAEAFSRYGEMSLDQDGFLIHNASQSKLLGYCGGEVEPINLQRFARSGDGSIAKSFRVGLNGSITAVYENGYARETCTVALALFHDSSKFERKVHVLKSTAESGVAFIGKPQNEGRGSIFGASLEELDEHMYQLNVKSGSADRVAQEMEKSRAANENWSKEKTLFYIFDLNVTREELSELEASTARCEKEIQAVVDLAENAQNQMAADEFALKIKTALDQQESQVLTILGQDRLEKAKRFREGFNNEVWNRFGTSLRFTAF